MFAPHEGNEKFSAFQVIREGDAIPVARLEQAESTELEFMGLLGFARPISTLEYPVV
jgi:hypothetical protein